MIRYDCVIDDKDRQVFGEVPGEVYNWLIRLGTTEWPKLTIVKRPSGEKESAEDYLFKVV